MAGEDQERFEDYLELEQFIAELQAGHAAHPSQELTPTQASVYRMALLFHSATPGVSEPTADFAAQLQAQLTKELQGQADERRLPHTSTSPVSRLPRRPRLARRSLLTGGAVVAASALIGAGVEYMGEKMMEHTSKVMHIVGSPTDWFPVMDVAELGTQAVKFVSEQMVGYIVRSDGANGNADDKGQVLAMSAACTHRGCIVQWSGADRKYHCPCHEGVFNEDGGIDKGSSSLYLNPLPRLDVKVEGGKIYVRVPPDA